MGKLNIPALLIGWLATIASGDIIYGKPAGLMQQLQQPSSSAVSPTVAQPNNGNNELLTGAESIYGPYGGHAFGGQHGLGHHGGLGGGGGGGDLAVVVTGGYKVADAPHHGIQHGLGLGGPHAFNAPHGGHIQGGHGVPLGGHIQGGHIQEGHGAPIAHHVPVVEHQHGDIGEYQFPGAQLQHEGHYGHHQRHHQGIHQGHHLRGYGYHVPSHGLLGHHHQRGHGYGHHYHHRHHGQGGFKPILAPVYGGYGHGHHLRHHHQQGLGHHHLQGHGLGGLGYAG